MKLKISIGQLLRQSKSWLPLTELISNLYASSERRSSVSMHTVVSLLAKWASELAQEEVELEVPEAPEDTVQDQKCVKEAASERSPDPGSGYIKLRLPHDPSLLEDLRKIADNPAEIFWSSSWRDYVIPARYEKKLEAFLVQRFSGKLLGKHAKEKIWVVADSEDQVAGLECRRLRVQNLADFLPENLKK